VTGSDEQKEPEESAPPDQDMTSGHSTPADEDTPSGDVTPPDERTQPDNLASPEQDAQPRHAAPPKGSMAAPRAVPIQQPSQGGAFDIDDLTVTLDREESVSDSSEVMMDLLFAAGMVLTPYIAEELPTASLLRPQLQLDTMRYEG
jgi:hypothetical protein